MKNMLVFIALFLNLIIKVIYNIIIKFKIYVVNFTSSLS